MMLSPNAQVLLGLLVSMWTLLAAFAVVSAQRRQRRAESALRNARRLARMVDEAPAVPILVRSDGRIEAPRRLAHWLMKEPELEEEALPASSRERKAGSTVSGPSNKAEVSPMEMGVITLAPISMLPIFATQESA